MDHSLHLEPVQEKHLQLLSQWWSSPVAAGDYDGTFDLSLEVVQRRFYKGLYTSVRIVSFNGEAIGWTDVHVFPSDPKIAGLTVQISKPDFRGRGLGLIIHKLAITQFLAKSEATEWIEAWTHVNNLAEQRILEKLGFKKSGPIKQIPINGMVADFFPYELQIVRMHLLKA